MDDEKTTMKDQVEYKVIYKCRLCKKMFSLESVKGTDKALNAFAKMQVFYNLPKISYTVPHTCSVNCIGMADFQGFVSVKEKE